MTFEVMCRPVTFVAPFTLVLAQTEFECPSMSGAKELGHLLIQNCESGAYSCNLPTVSVLRARIARDRSSSLCMPPRVHFALRWDARCRRDDSSMGFCRTRNCPNSRAQSFGSLETALT